MAAKITIADYGVGNLLNVVRAFEHCGADVRVTEDPADVAVAERLIVPGVGAFADSINELRQRGFADAVLRYAESGKPMFGICVGMQMLFDASEEFGEHSGLGIFPGRVVAVPSTTVEGLPQRIPHIGWSHLVSPEHGHDWQGTLLQSFESNRPAVYFVHSFAAQPLNESDRLADCLYGGRRICAAVRRNNIVATQFHPERSGEIGLTMIRNFLSL
ncbi:imidazole glycerol phosphate synthase subunit HisH [Herbaspirillum robiniae]|uniref:imidazole glycerol phosphate synthase subunit HisH n=1 Tax=Herbaspirillum robiniae TaxID=2014887 RepID=UPI003D776A36